MVGIFFCVKASLGSHEGGNKVFALLKSKGE